MRTFQQIKIIVDSVSASLLDRGYIIRFEKHPDSERMFLQVGMDRTCAYTGEKGQGFGGKYEVSAHSTEDEIVKKLLAACLAYAEHEVRENFFYKGKRVFNPHVTLEALMSISDQTTSRGEEGRLKWMPVVEYVPHDPDGCVWHGYAVGDKRESVCQYKNNWIGPSGYPKLGREEAYREAKEYCAMLNQQNDD